MSATINASVWIASVEASDAFPQTRRDLFRKVVAGRFEVIQPEFARAEIEGAVARRLRDSTQGGPFTHMLTNRVGTIAVALDAAFLAATETIGTDPFVRGAGAMHAVIARQSLGRLMSRDSEYLQ